MAASASALGVGQPRGLPSRSGVPHHLLLPTRAGKEVLQPTVVDAVSFGVWKDEAFGLWLSEWGSLYPEASPARALLAGIASTWWLVSVVDNDYVAGGDLAGLVLGGGGAGSGASSVAAASANGSV
jgi:hypothetical protein